MYARIGTELYSVYVLFDIAIFPLCSQLQVGIIKQSSPSTSHKRMRRKGLEESMEYRVIDRIEQLKAGITRCVLIFIEWAFTVLPTHVIIASDIPVFLLKTVNDVTYDSFIGKIGAT